MKREMILKLFDHCNNNTKFNNNIIIEEKDNFRLSPKVVSVKGPWHTYRKRATYKTHKG